MCSASPADAPPVLGHFIPAGPHEQLHVYCPLASPSPSGIWVTWLSQWLKFPLFEISASQIGHRVGFFLKSPTCLLVHGCCSSSPYRFDAESSLA